MSNVLCVSPLCGADGGSQLVLFMHTELDEWFSWTLWKQTHLPSCCLLLHSGYKQQPDSELLRGSVQDDFTTLAVTVLF